jgi:hypothetical protein
LDEVSGEGDEEMDDEGQADSEEDPFGDDEPAGDEGDESGADEDDEPADEEGDEVDDQGQGRGGERPRPGGVRQQQQPPKQAGPASPPGGGTEKPFEMHLPASGEALVFRLVECGISYPWSQRSWVIGPRTYGRVASVRLRASRLREPGHEVRATAESDRVQIDEFPGWARSYLEGPAYPFPIPQPDEVPLQRIIEPVLVGAVVAGLVYLFYQNQK